MNIADSTMFQSLTQETIMEGNISTENICPKWNKPVTEASCNICKDQCDLSIANPDHFIAKKLIVNLELVRANRKRHNLDVESDTESETNDISFLKTEIEETFKERADLIIESLGLAHMKVDDKEKEKL